MFKLRKYNDTIILCFKTYNHRNKNLHTFRYLIKGKNYTKKNYKTKTLTTPHQKKKKQ